MKLITLNTWGGRVHQPLLDFFRANADADIFCLQEIYHQAPREKIWKEITDDTFNLFSDIQGALPDHQGYFRPHLEDYYGLAIFAKKDIRVDREGDVSIYEVKDYAGGGNHPRNLQHLHFAKDGKNFTIANVHGLWNGKGKTDTADRLEQSRKIKEFIKTSSSAATILCGDFNLMPDTESVRALEDGMRNLVAEHSVQSTRTSLYAKPDKFADYIFVSPEIEVKNFAVLPDEVSDHAALFLEFK